MALFCQQAHAWPFTAESPLPVCSRLSSQVITAMAQVKFNLSFDLSQD